jgi:hypothetical protein
MFASPDEPSHMVRAEAVVHGQLSGSAGEDGARRFRVSKMFQERSKPWADAPCYAFTPDVTADCLEVPEDDGDHLVGSSAGEYPPALHILTGWPTLLAGGLKSLYFMRFANALVCAAMLTIAIRSAALLPAARIVLVGVALAVTPMVLFVSGTVNSSGVAATAGVAAWTGGVVLSRPEATRSLARSAAACAGPFCLLLLVRRDSLVWGAAIAVCLALLLDRERWGTLVRSRACLAWGITTAAVAVFQYAVTTSSSAESFRDAASDGQSASVSDALGVFWDLIFQAVGRLGWLDTRLPFLAYVVWVGAVVSLMLAVLSIAPRRPVVALASALILLVAVTTAIVSIRESYVQGRYLLPLAGGVPILATFGVAKAGGDRWVTRRMQLVVLGSLWLTHQLAFGQHLRRYVVGRHGSFDFVFGGAWNPPVLPVWAFLLSYMAATAAMMSVFAGVLGATSRDGRSGLGAATDDASSPVGATGPEVRDRREGRFLVQRTHRWWSRLGALARSGRGL